MASPQRLGFSAVAMVAFGVVALAAQGADPKPKTEPKKPQLMFKANPASGMVPVRVAGMVELRGGDDDYQEYYCPTIEWNWGDGTISESSNDCDPYEAGKSQIRRRYMVSHPYNQGGHYRISFRLKQKEKVVASITTVVQLLGGNPF